MCRLDKSQEHQKKCQKVIHLLILTKIFNDKIFLSQSFQFSHSYNN